MSFAYAIRGSCVKVLLTLVLFTPVLAFASNREPGSVETDAPALASSPVQQRPRSLALRIVRAAAIIAAAYVGLGVLALLMESKLTYYPMRYPAGEWEGHGLGVEDCTFEAADGVKLHAWWLGGAEDETAPVLLWFHGNAGNLTHRADNLRMLADRNMDVLIPDYRGYGKSQGRPSENGLYLDGEAALRYLTEERGVDPGRIICFGRSLGSSVALHVALKHEVAGVVLESPFASARAMARKMMPILPVGPFIRSRFDNVGMVADLTVPVLVMHGDRDELVPFTQGKAVFEAAREPKEFYTIVGAGHNDTYFTGGEPYFEALLGFCRRCVRQGH